MQRREGGSAKLLALLSGDRRDTHTNTHRTLSHAIKAVGEKETLSMWIVLLHSYHSLPQHNTKTKQKWEEEKENVCVAQYI